jgi:hypothetical protein
MSDRLSGESSNFEKSSGVIMDEMKILLADS